MPELIKIGQHKYSKSASTYDNTSSVSFALVSKPNPDQRIVTGVYTCRDWLSDAMRAAANKRNMSSGAAYYCDDTHDIDFDRLRLLAQTTRHATVRIKFEKNLRRAVNIINRYEELAGWNSRSRVVPVIFKEQKDIAWLITGPGEWMRASQAVSMVTLIIRVCVYSSKIEEVPRFIKPARIEKWFGKILAEYRSTKRQGHMNHSDMTTHLPNSYEKFKVIMKHYDTIFPANSRKVLLPSATQGSWHSCGGISTMCGEYGTKVPHIDNKLKECLAKEKEAK